jgi:hypothetical protein
MKKTNRIMTQSLNQTPTIEHRAAGIKKSQLIGVME